MSVADAQQRQQTGTDGELVRSISRSLRLSGVLWTVLGVLQVLGVVTIVAGAWNIYAAQSRFKIAQAVERREKWIPAAFEPLGGMITMAFINIVLGGVVGVVLVGLDVWTRSRVLENARVFDPGFVRTSEAPSVELPPTYGQVVSGQAPRDGEGK
jgi:predicted DNA repair protein MutK